jgi:hypothetical protein
MNKKFTAEQLENFWRDPANWKAETIYRCAQDPRVIVPKRRKWAGWTINFAHRFAWSALILIMVGMSGPLFLLAAAGLVNTPVWYASLVADVALVCLFCWFFALPKRFG